MLPNFPKYTLEKYIKNSIKPILKFRENNFKVREFIDEKEREEVYENTYGDLLNKLLESEEIEDKYNLELIHYIYDLLEYDKVVIINNEKLLYSYIYLNSYASIHLEAYEKLKISYEVKPKKYNIDIATNKTKDIQGRVGFLNPMLKPIAQNQFDELSKFKELEIRELNQLLKLFLV